MPDARVGEINLQACTTVTLGATFPTNGAPEPPYPNVLAPACNPAGPTKPPYAVAGFPTANCLALCQPPAGIKRGQKFNDHNHNGVKDPGDEGLNGWEIHVFGTETTGTPVHEHFTTANLPGFGDGFYTFSLNPGTYTVCETQKPGWTQSAPSAAVPAPPGETLADCTGHTVGSGGAVITPGPRGYTFTVVTGIGVLANNDFGNFTGGVCSKFSSLVPTTTVTLDPSKPNQIQTAINNASVNDVILLMPLNGTKKENIVINKKIQLIGCSVTLTAAATGSPVVQITSGADAGLTKDVHATGSTVAGYKIEGSNHSIQNVRSFGNAIGFWITGSSNVLKGTLGTTKNGTGFRIEGSSNTLDTNNGVSNNTGDGVVIAGGNQNVVKKFTVSGNGGNGIKVEAGAANTTLSENKAYSNGLNGYLILGTNTPMSRNVAGEIGSGNAGDGIRIVGNGGAMSENTSKGNGRVGIRVTGTGHTLSRTRSGGDPNQNNSSCQYVVGGSNTDGGQNTTSGNAAFAFTGAGGNSQAGCVPAAPTP